jgi:predicted peptidase
MSNANPTFPAQRVAPRIALRIALRVAAALLACSAAACQTLAPWTLAEGQHPQSFQAEVRKTVGLQFLLFLPRGYETQAEAWPLLIFLHGSGERGTDLEQVKVNGPPRFVQDHPEFPFVVVSPQVPPGMAWDSDAINALLDQLLARLHVDPDRVYLTGLSMGGYGAWNYATDFPDRLAALAPISGIGDSDRACRVKDLPIWAFHGAKDTVVDPKGEQDMIDEVRACGGNVRYTVYPDAGHDAWTPTYANPELYTWLLAQNHQHNKRSSPP